MTAAQLSGSTYS